MGSCDITAAGNVCHLAPASVINTAISLGIVLPRPSYVDNVNNELPSPLMT